MVGMVLGTFILLNRIANHMSETKEVPINSIYETFTSRLFISTLKLFNGFPTKTQKKTKLTTEITSITINHGFVFTPQMFGNFSKEKLESLITLISNEIELTPEQMNSTFHKSWGKVRDAPIEQLVFEQLTHYMTTYGYEQLGIYSDSTVFIPSEKLDVPSLKDGVRLTVINGYTKKQLKEKLLKLLNSGIALDTLDEIVEVAKYVELSDDEVLSLNNKEARVRLYKELKLIPEDPIELLRLALFEATDETLLITNMKTITAIKESTVDMTDLFDQYDEYFGYVRLAEIFQRFKRLFLAFKGKGEMSNIINLIGTLSKKHHIPMTPSYLNNITSMLSGGTAVYKSTLEKELSKVNIFRKIRLAQSLSYRMSGNKSIMYKIRNGKAFSTTFDFKNTEDARKVLSIILDSIAGDMKHLKGKEFYIPDNLTYSLPATAKQFTGNIPSGSFITIPQDMIFGVWWKNVDGHRIDLDLHMMALNAGHIGWNAGYRSGNRSILFTGDITSAPRGASELFYINKDYEDTVLLTLNYFNYRENIPVPFKIVIGEEHPNSFGSNYTIDPNNVRCVVPSVIDVKQKVIGLATVKNGECRFYFSETALGDSIAVRGGEYVDLARDYLANFATNQISLNDMLERVGAKIVNTPTAKSVDLSTENLQKDTFINLLVK